MARPVLNACIRSHGGSSRGFSLLELLVVVVIIGLLATILLPAVQHCREAARRTCCLNNLNQIGLALNNYMMAHEVLPSGTQNGIGPIHSKESGGYHMSWLTQILPYIDQKNAYDQIDFTKSVYDPANTPVRRHWINVLICPSHENSRKSVHPPTTYFGVHNDFETPIDVNQNGVLFLNSAIRYENFEDGISNTIVVMEGRLESGGSLGWISGTRSTLRNAVIAKTKRPSNVAGRAEDQFEPAFEMHMSPDDKVVAKASKEARFERESRQDFVGGPGSFHSGGLFAALLGDGSVRCVSRSIDPVTFRQIVHRADGEMTPISW